MLSAYVPVSGTLFVVNESDKKLRRINTDKRVRCIVPKKESHMRLGRFDAEQNTNPLFDCHENSFHLDKNGWVFKATKMIKR